MQNSVFFKSVINSDSILDSIGLLGQYLETLIGCQHICLLLPHDNGRNKLIPYSFKINQADLKLLQQMAIDTDLFSDMSSGMHLCITMSSAKPAIKLLSMTTFQSLYTFHLNRSVYGAILLCFRSPVQLTDEQLHICQMVTMQMEQLIEKIYFRKQVLKQQSYENLVNTLRMKDGFTLNHCYNVAFYASLLGAKVGVDAEQLEQLKISALLHDIGKIAIPDSILLKPGRLTDDEFSVIKQHPAIGYELLKDLPDVQKILPVVRWHHERIDGSGYPDGLSGDDIPLLVRIVSLADAFDAMTSTRVYRHSLPVFEVRRQLEINGGKQFDGQLVQAFLQMLDDHMIMDRLVWDE